ncbi:cytochrome c oxidase subunit 3 [Nocardia mikamii]|uniref:cytochrome c oxidase subunit 3 n=1 Tax=Nocardia mikamii TaxID=508464 RepID=UPI0007A451AC
MTVSDEEPSVGKSVAPKDIPRAPHLPGDPDMWVMVLGDLFFFGCYFVVYMVFRARSAADFAAAQQHLNLSIGVGNTIVLLTSSMFVALAVISVRQGAVASGRRLLAAAGGCGVVFAVLKVCEWYLEISRGHTVGTEFFSFYYALTGIHLAHLLLGMLILGIAGRELRNSCRPRVGLVEQGAVFWHMVDLLWIVIFAIVYLMR